MAVSQWYIDTTNGSDTTGTGSSGAPYKTTQHALNSINGGGAGPLQSAGGDQFNYINSTADDVLSAALSLTAYGTPSTSKPLIFYGSGITGGISGNSGNFSILSNTSIQGVSFQNMHLHHTGTATIINFNAAYGTFINCEFDHTSASVGIQGHLFEKCYFHDITSNTAVFCGQIIDSKCDFSNGLGLPISIVISAQYAALRNEIVLPSGSNNLTAINAANGYVTIDSNSIYSAGIGKIGIQDGGNPLCVFTNNIVEGFTAVGGIGLKSTSGALALSAGNHAYNNGSGGNYSYSGVITQGTDYNDTASNFNSPGTGDLSLVSTSTARGVSWPGTYPGSPTQTSYRDAGALQSQATGGGATPNYGIRTGGRM